jgi:hypothetical protein
MQYLCVNDPYILASWGLSTESQVLLGPFWEELSRIMSPGAGTGNYFHSVETLLPFDVDLLND